MILSKKSHGVSDKHINVTREYFRIIKSLTDNSDTVSMSSEARYILQTNEEACMELYRHCLCCALSLDTKLSYKELGSVVVYVTERLQIVLEYLSVLDKSDSYRKGFIEACMHCIVISRNSLRGDRS